MPPRRWRRRAVEQRMAAAGAFFQGLQVVAQRRPVRLALGQPQAVAGDGDQRRNQFVPEAFKKFARSAMKRLTCSAIHGRSA